MSKLLDRIKLLVIGLAVGLLTVNPSAQPPISPGFNVFRGVQGSATQPPFAFGGDLRSGIYLVAVGRPGLTASGVAVMDWTSARVLMNVPLQLGAAAAGTGLLRLTNAGTISSRNGALNADLVMFFLASDNFINIGNASTTGLRFGSGVVTRPTTGTFFLCVSSAGAVTASSGACSGS